MSWTFRVSETGMVYLYEHGQPVEISLDPERAGRICACLNAMEDIPTAEIHDALENGLLPMMYQEFLAWAKDVPVAIHQPGQHG